MGLYHGLVPSSKDNIQWPGTHLNRYQSYTNVSHGLNNACSDRSIVLYITWNYTMAWYPAHKILGYIMYKLLDVIK